jgi:orotate phosphoribosyltransferase
MSGIPESTDEVNGFASQSLSFIEKYIELLGLAGFSRGEYARDIALKFFQHGMIKTWYRHRPGGWEMRSGMWSPYYIDLRPLTSFRESWKMLPEVGIALGKTIDSQVPLANKGLGVAEAAIVLSAAVTGYSKLPTCYTRKMEEVRTVEDFDRILAKYGQHSLVEGEIRDSDTFVIIDDTVTRFDTKLVTKRQLDYELERRQRLTGKKIEGVRCDDVMVLIDREQGAEEVAREHGMRLFSVIKFASEALGWLKGMMEPIEYEVLKDYCNDWRPYQDEGRRKELQEMAMRESPFMRTLRPDSASSGDTA